MADPILDVDAINVTIGEIYSKAHEKGRQVGHQQGFKEGWQAALNAFVEAFPNALRAIASPPNAENPRMPFDQTIEDLEYGVRTYNCLKRAGIHTVGELVTKTPSDLNSIPNFGQKCVDEVVRELARWGYTLADDKPE